jgi:hypothetical protein
MTGPPPSGYGSKATGFALTTFVVSVALYFAVQLLLAVEPELIGLAALGLVGFIGWLVYRFKRSRW